MDFLRMLLQMFSGQQGGMQSGFGWGVPQPAMAAPQGPVEYLPYQIPPGQLQQQFPGLNPGAPGNALTGGGPGGNLNPVGGGNNWGSAIGYMPPSPTPPPTPPGAPMSMGPAGGGGLGFGGIGGGGWGSQQGSGRMYAGGNPNFNEMAGPWMTTALGGTGRINPLQPSGDQYTGSAGNFAPMAQYN